MRTNETVFLAFSTYLSAKYIFSSEFSFVTTIVLRKIWTNRIHTLHLWNINNWFVHARGLVKRSKMHCDQHEWRRVCPQRRLVRCTRKLIRQLLYRGQVWSWRHPCVLLLEEYTAIYSTRHRPANTYTIISVTYIRTHPPCLLLHEVSTWSMDHIEHPHYLKRKLC